ncbi:helix-turn-helix domain-containing protein [Streptomyces sp. URMC 126]|uniref:helix-turn-helix domain-containing protein n=1 Tax=Streptomyces sp. URMC 126 TaxID=3423401 RepID=UPI003F1BF7CD
MDGKSAPPVGWRYCGSQIKLWRIRAGVSREELAEAAGYSLDTICSVEQGRRRPSSRLLRVADEMFGAKGLLLAAEEYLQPERIVQYTQDYARYEAEAIAVCSFQPQLVPGLLQTEEYMRILHAGHWPPVDDVTIDQWVADRVKRQALLKHQDREFSFTIGEAAVRYPIGGKDAHARQLRHLLDVGHPRNVAVQVLRFGGSHVGLYGSFSLLETAEHKRLAYEEGQMTGTLYTDDDKVSALSRRHTMITRQAMPPEESTHFIRRLLEEL